MNPLDHVVPGLADLPGLARKLLATYPESRVFAFFGSMGAGKTTFIQALCQALDVRDTVTSPTFSLVNEYQRKNGEALFHFDFYRINRITEAMDIGYENYLYSGRYCFIEWPEKIEELLPADCVYVRIMDNGQDEGRIFRF